MIIKDFLDKSLNNFGEIRLHKKSDGHYTHLFLKDFLSPSEELENIRINDNRLDLFNLMIEYVKENFGKYWVQNFYFGKLPSDGKNDILNTYLELWY